jgi:histidinol phosphatase-like PHP family hydrolase
MNQIGGLEVCEPMFEGGRRKSKQGGTFTINRAAHTPPHRLSAATTEEMNQIGGPEVCEPMFEGGRWKSKQGGTFTINRAAHTPPHRLSAATVEKMNLFFAPKGFQWSDEPMAR